MSYLVVAAAVGYLIGGFSGAAWAVVGAAIIGLIGGIVDLMRG